MTRGWRYFDFLTDAGEAFLSLTNKDFKRKPIKQWGWWEHKFEIGDKIKLNACPFDEQIVEEKLLYMFLKDQVHTVIQTKHTTEYGTSGEWIKTDLMSDWTDAAWFDKLEIKVNNNV